MADVTQNVVVKFTSDTSGLETAEDRLQAMGAIDKQQANNFKATNDQLAKRNKLQDDEIKRAKQSQDIYAKLIASLKDLSGQSKQAVQSLLRMSPKELVAGFEQAAVSVEDYLAALKAAEGQSNDTGKASESLKGRLRELRAEMEKMALAGQDDTEQFEKLREEAGRVKNAIGDIAQEINNAGSDTRNLDNILGTAQAVAGGFAVAQGAVALFGDESEELQEVLLKLNAVMAITQGLQQIQNALQKEGAVTKLADTIVTKAQTVAQTAYNLVVGTSIGLMKAFKLALAATGIGIFVLAIVALYEAFQTTEENLKAVNDELERNKKLLDADLTSLERRTDLEIARAEAVGKAESDITKIRGRSLVQQRALTVQASKDLMIQRDALKASSEGWFNLNSQIEANNEAIRNIDQKLALEAIKLEGQVADERQKAAEEEKKRLEDLAKLRREAEIKNLEDQIAGIELRRLAAEKAGEDTLKFDQALIIKRAQLELKAEGLTENQKKLIRARGAAEVIKLTEDTAKKVSDAALQGLISQNNAELAQLNLTAQERLELTEANIITAAQLEINAAEGNSVKIKEIEAKRNAELLAARKKFSDESFAYEESIRSSQGGARSRQLARIENDVKQELQVRLDAIDEATDAELSKGDRRLTLINDQFKKGLISYSEYTQQYEALTDQQLAVVEDAEERKRKAIEQTEKAQKEANIRLVQTVVSTAEQVAGVLDALGQLQSDRDQQRFDARRKEIEDLRKNGAITEKEEAERIRRLEIEERKARQEQAKREKAAAAFKAILAIPQAVLTGLSQGGPVLAAIYGALAGVQAGIIAARPIPKFAKGKKKSDRYQGLGMVGEAGAELVEQNGQMYVATKPHVIWLNPEDRVYTARETREMLYKPGAATPSGGPKIDPDAIGKAVAKYMPQVGWNFDDRGFSSYIKQGQDIARYLNNRRG